VRPWIRDDTPQGEENRREVAALAAEGQPISHEMHGIEFGYRYSKSPVIAQEESVQDSTMRDYVPTAAPGARLPHLWRADGNPVHDALGSGYTLLCLDEQASTGPLERAMQRLGAPLETVRVPESHLRERYGADLLLMRPDLHVAWRGNDLPADADALARLVTGRT
jgi:hypothetical protein